MDAVAIYLPDGVEQASNLLDDSRAAASLFK
jgi:hypothetical protein